MASAYKGFRLRKTLCIWRIFVLMLYAKSLACSYFCTHSQSCNLKTGQSGRIFNSRLRVGADTNSVLRIPDSCWTASELVQYWSSIGSVLVHWRNVVLVFFIASLCFQFVKKSQPDKKGKESSTLYWLLYQFNCAHWANGWITKAYLKYLLARHCKGGLLGGGYWWNVSVSMDEGTGAFVKNTNQIQNVILYFCNRRSQRQSDPSSRDWTWRWNINNNRPRVSPSTYLCDRDYGWCIMFNSCN